ncbi:MAG: hypothetical protein CMF50_07760 [Legionellales bacterium]|nr:hypothetical protein [Legionellales bacterium]|tara:strand:- start:21277 stop:21738 length:462 start_codon:yes stop_codon:yes gene_type:complete
MGVFRSIGRGFRWTFKSFVDVPSWMGYRSIKGSSQSLADSAKIIFDVSESEREESYQEALKRLGLTEAEAQAKSKALFNLFLAFAGLGLAILCYSVFLAWEGALRSFLVGTTLALVSFATAFRYHFWHFQIKSKRLGCNFKDWWYGNLGGGNA